MEIDIPIDCGNSPGKLFIKELNLAFANGDIKFILDYLHDEIEWKMVGRH